MTLPFNSLVSTTLEHRLKTLEDNIFLDRPFLRWLTDRGHVKTYSGGTDIRQPIVLSENSSFQSFTKYETLNLTPQNPFTMAVYPWKSTAISVAISGEEEDMNNGEDGVIDLVDALVENAKESASANWNRLALTSDGTGNGGKNPQGLPALVKVGGTVGGVATADAATWDSLGGTGGAVTLATLDLRYLQTSIGNVGPDLELTSRENYASYISALTPQLRFTNTKYAEAGCENAKHMGATVFYDADLVDAGTSPWYMLNSKTLYLYKHSKRWMSVGPFIKPADQDARFSLIISRGNIGISSRRLNSVFTAVSNVTV